VGLWAAIVFFVWVGVAFWWKGWASYFGMVDGSISGIDEMVVVGRKV
jgi:hypothetical protein